MGLESGNVNTTSRLYPNATQKKVPYEWRRGMHCYLYNSGLGDRRDSYQRENKSVPYFDQQNRLPNFKKVWTKYKALGFQALQATLKVKAGWGFIESAQSRSLRPITHLC